MTYQEIIKREFEAASGEAVSSVEFTEDETIVVEASEGKYEMEIGSDDDEFGFLREGDGHLVTFGFPDDWWEARDGRL